VASTAGCRRESAYRGFSESRGGATIKKPVRSKMTERQVRESIREKEKITNGCATEYLWNVLQTKLRERWESMKGTVGNKFQRENQ